MIDFKRDKDGVPAKVAAIEYDPNRSANIALLHYADGEKRYILAPLGLAGRADGHVRARAPSRTPATACRWRDIPLGLHDPQRRAAARAAAASSCRSAGCAAQLTAREGDYAVVLLPSGELRRVHVRCRATIGRVGNIDHQNVKLGKAGRKRHMGRRPEVRGTAMNPVDHPHGRRRGPHRGRPSPLQPVGRARPRADDAHAATTRPTRFILRRRRKK